jgi:hypothetical protein
MGRQVGARNCIWLVLLRTVCFPSILLVDVKGQGLGEHINQVVPGGYPLPQAPS